MDERARKGSLGLLLERLLMIADEASADEKANDGADKRRDPDRARIDLEGAAKKIPARAKNRRPDDSARGVEEKNRSQLK